MKPKPKIPVSEQIRSFLRTFETECKSCMRDKSTCVTCMNNEAVRLAHMMDSATSSNNKTKVYNAVKEVKHLRPMASIYSQIQSAKHPITAREIHVQCSRSFKEWILKKLLKLGKIERVKMSEVRYLYQVKETKL